MLQILDLAMINICRCYSHGDKYYIDRMVDWWFVVAPCGALGVSLRLQSGLLEIAVGWG